MFRYPDKPVAQLARHGLCGLPETYIAELKLDGWRCVIERTAGGLSFTSRHNKPIPLTAELEAELEEMLFHMPAGTILDAEWLARRPSCRSESLWLFDIMQLGSLALWNQTTAERLSMLQAIAPAGLIAPHTNGDYAAFFDAMSERADAEGIVLKRRDATYIGSYRESANNPGWLKCKWRAGEDGLTAITKQLTGAR
jgi:ATP-dependent DNA ligase